jgi:hypothetical protein
MLPQSRAILNLWAGHLQEQRIGSLSTQLTGATSKLVAASVSEAALKSKLAAQKARANALQRRLKVSEAEGKELMARLAAAQLEAAGICEVPRLLYRSNRPYLALSGSTCIA